MLGYNLNTSSEEIYNEHERKLKICNKKYKDEMTLGYLIISDPIVINAYQKNTKEGWRFLQKCMKIPPNILINNYMDSSESMTLKRPVYNVKKQGKLHCYLCDNQLADSMLQTIKFMAIECDCQTMFCHTKCGNDFIMKYSSCDVCKKYYDVKPHCSSLRAIL